MECQESNGGYKSIEKIKSYVEEENFSGYLKELVKYNVLIQGYDKGLFETKSYNRYKNMELEDIYLEQEAVLNDLFANAIDDGLKSYNACEGLHELIDEMNEGIGVGFPYFNAPLLNDTTSGSLEGNITMFGGLSGMGKSTMTAMYYLPSILEHNEKVVIMINEEDEKKWKRELLIIISNSIMENKKKIVKKELRDGNFTNETMEILRASANYLEEKKKNRNITIIPFSRYKTSLAVKIIKKYANMGVKYFILDTFKADSDSSGEKTWLDMQKASVELYDTIKPSNKNVHLWFTFQLAKQSSTQLHYSQDNIGMAKNIIDVASVCIMVRKLTDNEKKELRVYRIDKDKPNHKITVNINHDDKRYVALFIVKNRHGNANDRQIIAECDLSKNTYKEVGYAHIPED